MKIFPGDHVFQTAANLGRRNSILFRNSGVTNFGNSGQCWQMGTQGGRGGAGGGGASLFMTCCSCLEEAVGVNTKVEFVVSWDDNDGKS